jgi:lipopolysaccharide transport system ATP-binding protein
MASSAISAHGLIKEYHLYDSPYERFKELFIKAGNHKVFRALGPLNIDIPEGETLGIVGENGAGKSTFLKLVAGVIKPSSGDVCVRGRVSSILELGTGFHPDFTGRENVLLNASLHGLSPKEVGQKMPDITAFADIGGFFDMPVKFYSSGMYLRLAFSMAVHVDADILVIDEALAVGDGAYVKKCIDRIWELKRKGITILFCSHSLYTIVNFCDRAIWLKEGRMEAIGPAKETVDRYEEYLRLKSPEAKSPPQDAGARVAGVKGISLSSNGKPVEDGIEHMAELNVMVEFEVSEEKDIYAGFAIDRSDGLLVSASSMVMEGIKPFRGPGVFGITLNFPSLPLATGKYKVVIFLLDETGICIYDRAESGLFGIKAETAKFGICHMAHKWEHAERSSG